MESAGIERISVPKKWRIVILCNRVYPKVDGEINPICSYLSHLKLKPPYFLVAITCYSLTPYLETTHNHTIALAPSPRLWAEHFPGDAMAIGRQIQPDRRGVAKLPGLREPFNARNEFREPVEAVEDWLRLKNNPSCHSLSQLFCMCFLMI